MKLLLIRTEAAPAADRLRFSSLILFQVNLKFTFLFVAHTSLDFRRQLKILSIYLVRTATDLLKVNIVSGMFIRSDKSWSLLTHLSLLLSCSCKIKNSPYSGRSFNLVFLHFTSSEDSSPSHLVVFLEANATTPVSRSSQGNYNFL